MEEREFSTGFARREAAGEEEERLIPQELGDGEECAGAKANRENDPFRTPIWRFIPQNPRDGAEMAFPGALRLAQRKAVISG